ncbi:MAG: alpha/beta hydrolase fold domain-containing protein [Pirellulales bacterium]
MKLPEIARQLAGACVVFLAVTAGAFGQIAPGAEPHAVVGEAALWRNLAYSDASKSCVLDLALPLAKSERPRPAIVVIHGGGWLEGDKSSFSTPEVPTPGNIFDFARRGFVAATINYRLSGEAPYPAALTDCQQAILWLRAHAKEYGIDAQRIGAYGNSAGGHLALLVAMTDAEPPQDGKVLARLSLSSRVQAAVSDSGPLDLVFGHEHNQLLTVIEKFLGGPPQGERLAQYRRASPSTYTAEKLPPLLLIYGVEDEQVDVRTADQFVAALGAAGQRDVSYLRLAAVGHCPHSLVRVPYVRGVVEDFFVRVLKP